VKKSEPLQKQFMRKLEDLSRSRGIREVFRELVEIMALFISNSVDADHYDARKERYLQIVKPYSGTDLGSMAELFAMVQLMIIEHDDNPCDVLGAIYMEIGAANQKSGQVFTPDYICRLMAALVGIPPKQEIMGKGCYTLNDPACGSGALIIGYIYEMRRAGIEYDKVFATLEDIDIICVCMAYVQLSLYGVPAVVIHGNPLTMEEWSTWWTPACRVLMKEQENERVEGAGSSYI